MIKKLVSASALAVGLTTGLALVAAPASASPADGWGHLFLRANTQNMYDAAVVGEEAFARTCDGMNGPDRNECASLEDWWFSVADMGAPNGECLNLVWPIWGEQPQLDYWECEG
jgi:hypothetical protein